MKKTCSIIIAIMLALPMTACEVNVNLNTNGSPVKESKEETATPKMSEPDRELSKRFETEKPWINSNVMGTISDSGYDPDIRDDFYVAVNKEWFDDATLPAGYFQSGGIPDIMLLRREQVMSLMEDDSVKGEAADRVHNLYNLWLDWDLRNSTDNIGEIRKHIDPVTAITSMDELTEYLVSEECLYYGEPPMDIYIASDSDDSTKYCVNIDPTPLTLDDAAEYEALTDNGARAREASDAVSAYMLGRLGYSEDDAEALVDAKYDFEKKIAEYEMTHAEVKSPDSVDKTNNHVTIDELAEKSPEYPIVEMMKTAGVADSKLINLNEPKWLEGINELYTEDNLDGIKSYLIDRIASRYISIIDEDAYRTWQDISEKRNGITERATDRDEAYKFTSDKLSSSVARMFVQEYMTPEIKEDITGIIDSAVDYYREMLTNTPWLSEETRNEAIEKLDNIGINAAYPDKWKDQSSLKISDKTEGETLLSAIYKIGVFDQEYMVSLVNTDVDKSLWQVENVDAVNSFYSPTRNDIYIIAGILAGDVYRPDMSYEEKLGGIGTVIGHELSHAFDTIGAQYDKNGNIKRWWSDEDYTTFQKRADRLIDYMGSMTVNESGKNYNGKLVQTETIADMAGMKCMLGIASKTDDFDYDKFFRNYAKVWKKIETRERSDYLTAVDVHALAYLRVNAVVQQFDEFHETYGIKEGDGMYLAPDDRVSVW